MSAKQSNRYRVSSNFTALKIVIYLFFFLIAFYLIRDIANDTFELKSALVPALMALVSVGLLYLIKKRKIFIYDDILLILYIYDSKGQLETEVPVEKIDKILYSSSDSWVIVYRGPHNQMQKARLFTIPYSNDIDIIITDAKLKNPKLVTRKWSFGWNEFFD